MPAESLYAGLQNSFAFSTSMVPIASTFLCKSTHVGSWIALINGFSKLATWEFVGIIMLYLQAPQNGQSQQCDLLPWWSCGKKVVLEKPILKWWTGKQVCLKPKLYCGSLADVTD